MATRCSETATSLQTAQAIVTARRGVWRVSSTAESRPDLRAPRHWPYFGPKVGEYSSIRSHFSLSFPPYSSLSPFRGFVGVREHCEFPKCDFLCCCMQVNAFPCGGALQLKWSLVDISRHMSLGGIFSPLSGMHSHIFRISELDTILHCETTYIQS